MTYTVYILFSPSIGKYYVGQTQDIDERLTRHNSGRVTSTSRGVPWILIKTLQVETRSLAVKLETRIKKRGIARFLDGNGYNK